MVGKPLRLWAHRGGRKEVSENTAQALDHASQLGLGWLETDVQLSADGVVFLHHNPDLEVPYGETALTSELTWEKISQLRTKTGAHAITLAEALQRYPNLYFNIEPKSDEVVKPALAVVAELGEQCRVSWAAFSSKTMFRIRLDFLRRAFADVFHQLNHGSARHFRSKELAKPLTTVTPLRFPSYLGAEPLQVGLVKGLAELGGSCHRRSRQDTARNHRRRSRLCSAWPGSRLQIPVSFKGLKLVDERLVATAHQLGMAVDVWTINDFSQALELYELGVDGIMTDYPHAFARDFRAAGVPLETYRAN